jgi:16S rRNA (guanine(527)-N(7))-methyltransferase RsmG
MFHVKHADTAITPHDRARLEAFSELLLRWNQKINLISRADEAALWSRHILDSAQLVPLLPHAPGTLIDLGSGAGFPGLVLALLTEWRVHLVEADRRKAAFLREAARECGATVTIHAIRAEALRTDPADVVTARALAPLDALLPLAAPLLRPDGICLFPKGRAVADELTAAAARWHMRVECFPSNTDPGATLVRISEICRAG